MYENTEIGTKYIHKNDENEMVFEVEHATEYNFGAGLKDALNKLAECTDEEGKAIGQDMAAQIIHQYYVLHAKVVLQNTIRAGIATLCKDAAGVDDKPEQELVETTVAALIADWVPTFKVSIKKTPVEKVHDILKGLNEDQRAAMMREIEKALSE